MPDELNPLDSLTSTPEGGEVQPADAGQGQPASDTSAVQPEGQGQPDAQTGLYDLSTVPEEHRSYVEEHLKNVERNVNGKLQEAAEFRKNWEPYSAIEGLSEYGPDGVQALLDLAEALAGDNARDALMNLAESLDIDLTPEAAAAAPAEGEEIPAAVQARIDALEARLAERDEREQYATVYEQQLEAVQAEYAEVEAMHGKPFSAKEKDRLVDLAKRFQSTHDEPIKAAYAFISDIAGGAEAALVEAQPTPPAAAERGGRASTTPKPVDSFEEAERIHKERNASAHA